MWRRRARTSLTGLLFALVAATCQSGTDQAVEPQGQPDQGSAPTATTPDGGDNESRDDPIQSLPTPTAAPKTSVIQAVDWPPGGNLLNNLAATLNWLGFSATQARGLGDPGTMVSTYAPIDEWDRRPPVDLVMRTDLTIPDGFIDEFDRDGVTVTLGQLTLPDGVLQRAWIDCSDVLVALAEGEPDSWDTDALVAMAAELGSHDCGRDRPFDPLTGSLVVNRQPPDPFTASAFLRQVGKPVGIHPSAAFGYFDAVRVNWQECSPDTQAVALAVEGYDVAAAEAGSLPMFDINPRSIEGVEAQVGSVLLELVFVAGDRAFVILHCDRDVTVLDLGMDNSGRITALNDRIALADFVKSGTGVAAELQVEEGALRLYLVSYQDPTTSEPSEPSGGVDIFFDDNNRIEPHESVRTALTAPGTSLQWMTELAPFEGKGDTWRFVVDATDDGVDNFVLAERDPLVRYGFGQRGPWFGPESLMVWMGIYDGTSTTHVGRYEPDGHLVDTHFVSLESASKWTRGGIYAWQVAFLDDGRVLMLGNAVAWQGVQGPSGVPTHAWYDPESDDQWLNTADAAPAIDWEKPVVEVEGLASWYAGSDVSSEVGSRADECDTNLYFEGHDGIERVFPTGSRVGRIVDTLVGDRYEWNSSDQAATESWGQPMWLLSHCAADAQGFRLWSFYLSSSGFGVTRSLGTVKALVGVVDSARETDQAEVELEDGTVVVLPSDLFESVHPVYRSESRASNEPIDVSMIGSAQPNDPPFTSALDAVYEIAARTLGDHEFEPEPLRWHRADGATGELRATQPNIASLRVSVEQVPYLSGYADGRSVDGVVVFYPAENDIRITQRLAFWCGDVLVDLTSTGGQGEPYSLEELEGFAREISSHCASIE